MLNQPLGFKKFFFFLMNQRLGWPNMRWKTIQHLSNIQFIPWQLSWPLCYLVTGLNKQYALCKLLSINPSINNTDQLISVIYW